MCSEETTRPANRLSSLFPDLSVLGFGSWALGGEYWGPQDHGDSVRAIHRALHLGINHFDTAPVYGKGRSEQLLGQQLKKIRGRCIIATKAFYSDPERMKASLETSLRRLLTDYIDIFYIHWPLGDADMRPGMEMLESLRREGRIRALGVSNFSADQIRMVEEAGRVDVYQGGYNLLWTAPEREILPLLKEREIAFVPYGILGQGLLTGSGLEHLQTEHKGFRHKMVLYRPEIRSALWELLERVQTGCARAKVSVEQAAARYCLDRSGAASVLLGCRSRAQAERNFAPLPDLPRELKETLDDIALQARELVPAAPNLFDHKS